MFLDIMTFEQTAPLVLPSPRGDELFRPLLQISSGVTCYRPLAGMNCFVPYTDLNYMLHRLPSPRGDELFRGERMTIEERKQLPSPRGDELFHQSIQLYSQTEIVTVPSRG